MHTQTDNRPRRLVAFDLPPETVEEIDRLADAETISRAAWMQWAEAIRDEEAA
jgi:hypothetical protein